MMLASIVLPRPTSSARMARPPIWRSTRWATSIWWGSSLIALASRVMSRSKPGTRAMRSASRRSSYQARSAGGSLSLSAKALRERSSTAQESSGGWSGSVMSCLRVGGRNIQSGPPEPPGPGTTVVRRAKRRRWSSLGALTAPPRAVESVPAQTGLKEHDMAAKHVSPEWPEGYWPAEDAPEHDVAWDESVLQVKRDLRAMARLVADPKTDLFTRIPHGTGQTVLREALVLADHNSYHLGQLLLLRRLLGAYKEPGR